MNTDELEWALMKAERRVLEIQTKLLGSGMAAALRTVGNGGLVRRRRTTTRDPRCGSSP
ncbi:hypothetical protein [Streptomyces sp. NBC_00893]|uniref:hypothetical protein n=1 Tax=Streptomyces sp. NBC_00893 TaxID=2975862 RepID=UPI002256AD2F|nr:hypothetical protein [Streptomyces sp. NBC_00893]MCX4850933.1 hypothetical protein [Streptomyces sp. NBC_00893]